MLKPFEKLLSRFSLFWRYFILFALMTATFVVALISANTVSSQSLQDTFLQQTRESFYHNCSSFSDRLFRNHSIPTTIEASDSFLPASIAVSPTTPSEQLHFHSLQQLFGNQCFVMGTTKAFIYFGNSGVCVTSDQLFLDPEKCFSSYLLYEGSTDALGTVRSLLQARPQPSYQKLLPASSVGTKTMQPDTYLTMLIRPESRNQVYGFLYSTQSILDQFHIDTLPEGTCFELVRDDGTVLFSHGSTTDRTDFTEFSSPLTTLACRAVIRIPSTYFREATQQGQARTIPIFILSILLGVVMCFVFSHTSALPIRRLVKAHSSSAASSTNELVAISDFMTAAREKAAAMQSMLLSSMLVRTFSGLPVTEEEYQSLSASSPLFQSPLRAAIFRDRMLPGSEPSMLSSLQSYLSGEFLCEYVNDQEAILLFPADARSFNHLQSVIQDLNGDSYDTPRFVCGVSSPFTGLPTLTEAIRQAQFCVPEDGVRVLVSYSEKAQPASAAGSVQFDLKLFQQALANWNQQATLNHLEQLAQIIARDDQAQPEEIYYNLLHILRQTTDTGAISIAQSDLAYQYTVSPTTNIRRLKGVIESLFQQRAQLQVSEQKQLTQDIIDYIRSNFSDPNLCPFSLAQHFSTSERFIHRSVLSVTRMNFNDFVTYTRMEEAARLLRQPDIPINTVAEKCGYYVRSTFYRNFRKHFNVTPLEFKRNAAKPE